MGHTIEPLKQVIPRQSITDAQVAVQAEVVTRYNLDAVFMNQAPAHLGLNRWRQKVAQVHRRPLACFGQLSHWRWLVALAI